MLDKGPEMLFRLIKIFMVDKASDMFFRLAK